MPNEADNIGITLQTNTGKPSPIPKKITNYKNKKRKTLYLLRPA